MGYHWSYVLSAILVSLLHDPAEGECEHIMIGYLPLKTVKSPDGSPTWPIEAITRVGKNWHSYVPTPPRESSIVRRYGTCYNATFIHIEYPEEEWVYKDVYNRKTLSTLSWVDVVVGHYLPAIERYCKAKKIAYILSLPPTIEVEERMLREDNRRRVMFSAWPSWENFFRLSLKALHIFRGRAGHEVNTIGRVFIWAEGPDRELHAVANKLSQVLQTGRRAAADAVMVRMFDMDTRGKLAHMLYSILDLISEFDADIVVFMYKLENNLKYLFEAVDLFRSRFKSMVGSQNVQWLFWDMRTEFNGILSKLLSKDGYDVAKVVKPRSIDLYTIKPFDLTCDNITSDITEIVGANDAASMALLNAASIPEPEFARDTLLASLRKMKVYLAGINSRQQDHWMNIHSGWSFRNGFRVFAAVSIGLILPDAAYSEEEEEGHEGHESDFGSSEDAPDVITGCKPRLEFFLSYYYEKKRDGVALHTEPLEVALKQNKAENRIVVVLEEPFAMRGSGRGERYTGIAPMILKEAFFRMSQHTGILHKYKIYHTDGNEYGIIDHEKKTWTGAFGELQQKKAVMAIGMISKTILRQRDFDFSPTYEFVGITFIIRKSEHVPGYFAFMRPFHESVWWGLLVVMMLSSLFINLLDRWNPYMDKIEQDKRFRGRESMWWSFGTITQAGGEFAPTMLPTRIFSLFYWFFALVVTACYTGNLASFLVEQEHFVQVEELAKLPSMPHLKWGTLKGSYMEDYIRHTNSTHDFTKLALALQYVTNYEEGAKRAADGDYAFIGTSRLLQFYTAKDPHCELALGPHLESFTEIAFPMARDWPLQHEFTKAMGSMRSDGSMKTILQRWLPRTSCSNDDDDEDHMQLHFDNFNGIFILLGVFYFLSYIVLAFKLGWLKLKERNKKMREAEQENKRQDEDGLHSPMIERTEDAGSIPVRETVV